MKAQVILDTLSRRGAVLTADGDALRVTPRDVLDDALRADIRASKRELLALLEAASGQVEPQVLAAPTDLDDSQAVAQVLEAGPLFEPPEPPPSNPAWLTPATWNAQRGLWRRCGGVVPTAATRAAFWNHRARNAAAPSPTSSTPYIT